MSDLDYTNVRTQEIVMNLLRLGEVTVVFTKKDGTERVLRCTLDPSIIPEEDMPKGTSTKPKNESVQAVYDVENEGWRSFTWESITEVSV